jgi:hypothetical protein
MHLGQKCSYFYPIFIWLWFLYLSGIVTDAFSLQSRMTSLSFRCGTTINTLNSGIEAKDAFTSMFLSSSTRFKSVLSYTRPYIGFALSCVNSDSTFDDSDAEVQEILDMAMGEVSKMLFLMYTYIYIYIYVYISTIYLYVFIYIFIYMYTYIRI